MSESTRACGLHEDFLASARSDGEAPAVEEETGTQSTYRELEALSARTRDRLAALGVQPGDRVGMCLTKSVDAVAALLGALRRGAAYVPVDVYGPIARSAFVLHDCSAKVVVVERRLAAALHAEWEQLGPVPPFLVVDGTGGGASLDEALRRADADGEAPGVTDHDSAADDLAYILYTSGSTGVPKGVMLTHRNARSFVDWCVRSFRPTSADRFSSHAPFHFDLSILDLYVPLAAGACLVLVSKDTGNDPVKLAKLIASTRISVWYSVPSILALLAQYGRLAAHDYGALRTVLFAGEVFPVAHLRALSALWPHCDYHNLYGPTETNVCTAFKVPTPIEAERTQPYPIGAVCDQLRGVVVASDGTVVPAGEEGELCITGPNVMAGYWNRPDLTERAFLTIGDERFYRTGDLVQDSGGGCYSYVGRRDRMVKKRGFRVELGEIEACLYRHHDVSEAAVVAVQDGMDGLRVDAHIASRTGERLSLIALKQFCAERLPMYMVPDKIRFHASLPRTGTDKVDYQALNALR